MEGYKVSVRHFVFTRYHDDTHDAPRKDASPATMRAAVRNAIQLRSKTFCNAMHDVQDQRLDDASDVHDAQAVKEFASTVRYCLINVSSGEDGSLGLLSIRN